MCYIRHLVLCLPFWRPRIRVSIIGAVTASIFKIYSVSQKTILITPGAMGAWSRSQIRLKCSVEFVVVKYYVHICGPGSSVGIATGYGLGRSGDQIQVGSRFSAPVQTGPGAHPASCTIGTGSLPGWNAAGAWSWPPHPLLVPWSWKDRVITLLPLWAVQPVQSLSACTRVSFFKYYV